MPSIDRVYILIVNWNGWGDTIECLESVFRNNYSEFRVIVCDNGSMDGSLPHIRSWAKGELDSFVPPGNSLRRLSHPPIRKPVPVKEYDRARAEAGGTDSDPDAPLILVANEENLGYAGGNNVGLRYVLARDDFEYVWLLNNDTVMEPDALSQLVSTMKANPYAGICGSTLPFYGSPDILWARGGGRYNKWIPFFSRAIDHLTPVARPCNPLEIERKIDFVAGASMMVSRPFLREIGLLCEDYFLYFEELDWTMRARGRFRLAYSPDSIVFHKVGASTGMMGSFPTEGNKTLRYYIRRSSIMFTRKYHPYTLPIVYSCFVAYGIFSFFRDRIRKRVGRKGTP